MIEHRWDRIARLEEQRGRLRACVLAWLDGKTPEELADYFEKNRDFFPISYRLNGITALRAIQSGDLQDD